MFAVYLKWCLLPIRRTPSPSIPPTPHRQRQADAMATQAHDGPIDPFKDWAKEFMHLEPWWLKQKMEGDLTTQMTKW